MNNKTLKILASQNRKKNGTFAILIFIFCAFFIGAISLLDLLIGDFIFFVLILPLIVLPIAFSFDFLILFKDQIGGLTFTNLWIGIKTYFTERFNSTFNFIQTAFKLIIIFLILSLFSFMIINLSLYNTNAFDYRIMVDEFTLIYDSGMTIESLSVFINEHMDTINIAFTLCNIVPALGCVIFLVRTFYINSISIFLRKDFINYKGHYINYLHTHFVKEHRKSILKKEFSLNWPYYLAFVGFYVLGGYLGSLYKIMPICIFSFALTSSLFFTYAIFGSFLFANKEAIYEDLKRDYIIYDVSLQTRMLQNITYDVNFGNHQDNNGEEDNKKDSDES